MTKASSIDGGSAIDDDYSEDESDSSQEDEANDVRRRLGMIFTHVSEDNFILFIPAVNENYDVYIDDIGDKSVTIVRTCQPPPDDILRAGGIRAGEANFRRTIDTAVVKTKRLLTRRQESMKSFYHPSKDDPKWLIVNIPWRVGTDDDDVRFRPGIRRQE